MDDDRDSGYYTGGRGGYYSNPNSSYSTMPTRGARGANVYRIVVPQGQGGHASPQVIHLGGRGAASAQPQVIRIAPRSTDASGGGPGPQVIRLTGDSVGQGVRIVPAGDSTQTVRVVQDSGPGSSVQYIPGNPPQSFRVVQGNLPQGVRVIQTGGRQTSVEEPSRSQYVRETPQGIRIVSSGSGSTSPQIRQEAPGVRIYPMTQTVREVPVQSEPGQPESRQSSRFRLIQMPTGFRMISSEEPPQRTPSPQTSPVRIIRLNSGQESPVYSSYSTLPSQSSYSTLPSRSGSSPALSRATSVSSTLDGSGAPGSPIIEPGDPLHYGTAGPDMGQGSRKVSLTPSDGSESITLTPTGTGSFTFSPDSPGMEGMEMSEAVDDKGEKVYLLKMAQPKNKQTQFHEAYESRKNRRKLQEFDDMVNSNMTRYLNRPEIRFEKDDSPQRGDGRGSPQMVDGRGSPQRGEGRGSPVTVTVHTPGAADRNSPIRFHIRGRSFDEDGTPPRRGSADSPRVKFEDRGSPPLGPQRTMLRSATLDSPSNESTPKNLFNKCKFNFGSIGNFGRSNSRESSSDSEGSGNAVFFQDFDDMIGRIRKARQSRAQVHPEACTCQGETSPKHHGGGGGGPAARPKSFLREEVDEFDRIFSELLLSSREKFEEDIKCSDPAVTTMGDHNKNVAKRNSFTAEDGDGERTPTRRSPRSFNSFCDTTNSVASESSAQQGASSSSCSSSSSQRDSGLFESSPLHSKFSKLFEDNEKLFSQLLDDLDNISCSNTKSLQRRRRARDLFSDWLFSEDALSPEQPVREKCREALKDLSRRRVQSARDSYDIRPREVFTRWRPKSFEYQSEDDADSGYHTGNSTLQGPRGKPPPGERTLTREDLRRRIETFNDNNHGLIMSLQQESETFQGFIRVHMNLIRPINMSISTRPPSIYDVLTNQESDGEDTMEDAQITSFYLPKDTTKVIHIDSETTAQEVIRVLLQKFKITDNPRKFALYSKVCSDKADSKSRGMQRLADDETPLQLSLGWTNEGLEGLDKNKFILQENDTGEIMWDAFSVPELTNFLRILGREEEEYVDQVKNKYRLLKIQMSKRLKELDKDRQKEVTQKDAEEGKFPPADKREPVFV